MNNLEFLEDLFTALVVFETGKNTKNKCLQHLLCYLALFYFSIVLYEYFSKQEYFKKDNPELIKFLDKWRMFFTKEKISDDAEKIEIIVKEMGIDFDSVAFDTVIFVNSEEKLFGINFGTWKTSTLKGEELEQFLVITESVKAALKQVAGDELYERIEAIVKSFANELDKLFNLDAFSYSSRNLFEKSKIEVGDRFFIMYYYSFVKTLLLSEKIVPNLALKIGGIKISVKKSLMKAKAVLVGSIWENLKDRNTDMSNSLLNELEKIETENIYILNRRLRNNIHYSVTDALSQEELDRIEKFQNDYLKILLLEFDKYIKINLGIMYKAKRWIANHVDLDYKEYIRSIEQL